MMQGLYNVLRGEAERLKSEFRSASIQGHGTSQEIADFREGAFQSFIERYFPFPHRVTKGGINDSYGRRSNSIDCVICNPIHPYTIDSSGKFRLLFADGVDVAIELKPSLKDKNELNRGLAQGVSVKQLMRAQSPILMPRMNNVPDSIMNDSRRVPFFLFAMEAKPEPQDIISDVLSYYSENKTPIDHQADFIVVNDVGVFRNNKLPEMFPFTGAQSDAEKVGWFLEAWGEDTLAGLLLALNNVPHATVGWGPNIMSLYIGKSRPDFPISKLS